MFRASSALLQEGIVAYKQPMLLSLCKQVSGRILLKLNHVLVILDHSPVYRVTVTYAACVQLYPPEDEHLRLDTCRGECYSMNK